MMKLIRPHVLREDEVSDNVAKLDIQPLERGVGTTIGGLFESYFINNFHGTSPYALKFSHVKVEDIFTEITGVKEDLGDIIDNVKMISVLRKETDETDVIFSLEVSGKKVVKAKDLQISSNNFEIANPNQILFHADTNKKFKFDIMAKYSSGYYFAEDFESLKDFKKDFYSFDAGFSPVEYFNYKVDNARVGQSINYDLLKMEYSVKPGYDPIKVYKETIDFLREEFSLISDSIPDEVNTISIEDASSNEYNPNLSISINDLELSIRCRNCLKQINVETLSDLSKVTTSQLMTINNFGKKSLDELREVMGNFGLTLKEE